MEASNSEHGDRLHPTVQRMDAARDSFADELQAGNHPQIETTLDAVPLDEREALLLELLAVELLYRHQSAEPVSSDEYELRFPQAADEIQRLFAELPTLNPGEGGLVSTVSNVKKGDGPRYRVTGDRPTLGQFGDYELLEEIARGGMGVVYRALQKKANRIVALKMILSGQLASQEEVQRFRSEAEAAAILDHPNIVPVFDVGEHNGQPYFSMGYVDGKSLGEVLRDGPLPPKEAAGIVQTIAGAIACAHENGVIHRDLKPSNVLLDKSGNLRVTDFGLAKQVESDSDLTATGQVMGTPSFMPPEQAAGDLARVDVRSDVYSLGAILYMLLTGRPPFQSANMIETLRQVIDDVPVEPRLLNRSVDQDLETVCLKCLEKDPSQRYQQAQELSDELGRYLEGSPILARSVTRRERVWRWCKRQPLLAGLSFAAVASLLLGTGVALYFAVLAQQRATHAQEGTRVALTALETMIDKVQNGLRNVPGAQEVRRELLQEALTSLQQVSGELQTQSRVDRDTAVALVDLALLFGEFGDEEGLNSVAVAESNYRASIDIFRELVQPGEEDVPLLRDYAWSLGQAGNFYLDQNRVSEAKEPLQEALAIRRRIAIGHPEDVQHQLRLSLSLADWGDYLAMSRNFGSAIEAFEEAIPLAVAATKAAPENLDVLRHLGGCYEKAGDAYHDQQMNDKAYEYFQKSRDTVHRMYEIDPKSPLALDSVSLSYERMGNHWLQVGDAEQALGMYEKMKEFIEKALEIDPTNRILREGLATAYNKLARAQSTLGQREAANSSQREAAQIRQELSVRTDSP